MCIGKILKWIVYLFVMGWPPKVVKQTVCGSYTNICRELFSGIFSIFHLRWYNKYGKVGKGNSRSKYLIKNVFYKFL